MKRRVRRKKGTPLVEVDRSKAIYLRKSRDESQGKDDVLSKHRMQLVDMCEHNGWEYVIYEEVESADSLDARPKMLELLDHVEDGVYDGVIVMEYERLSRGDQMDAAHIMSVFQDANVKIITPTQTYDLQDETSEALLGVAAIFARMEYRKIKRRLLRGKVNGAKQGKWVQGPTPFPYVTAADPDIDHRRIVVVDEQQRPHYETMLSDALAGISPGDIAIKLNAMGVKTNRKGTWVAETVQRVLLNPFHMGRIIYGKTKVDKDGERTSVDPDDWIVSEGSHERLKTPEQHARLIDLITSRRRISNKSLEGRTPLSGLVKCALCGKTHQSTVHRGRYVLFACHRRSPIGEICSNGGAPADAVYRVIESEAAKNLVRLSEYTDATRSRAVGLPTLIEAKRRALADEETKLSKLVDLVVSGLVSKDVFTDKKAPIDASIQRLKATIAELEASSATGDMPTDERRAKLSTIVSGDFWTSGELSGRDRHRILSTLIDHITLRAQISRKKNETSSVDVVVHWR